MVKNFFLNIVKLKEKVFSLLLPKYKFLFLAILFFAILWPLYFAAAQIFGLDLGNLVANAIFLLFFKIFIEIGNLILQVSLLMLNWVLSDSFIPWSYTNANNNPIILIGWQITRDLANMSFIVILVAIGLGTALKLQEYQVQKTLPTLILIALLINFTPVLLGLMVDAANITMNFFLESVSGLDAWGRVSEAQAAVIIQTLVRGGIVLGLIPAIFQAMLMFVINLLSAAIIIAFAGLFMIRYIAIWILVILSPIVFAMYILPGTRKMYWNQWWSQFTQWTIIGIPAAFFLYLGNHIMIDAPGMNLNPPSGGIWDITFLTFIRAIMPYVIALMFLWIGFFVALTSSAMGASGVIQTVQKGVKKLPNTRYAQWAKGKAAGAGLATLGATAKTAERLDRAVGKLGLGGLQIVTKPTAWAVRSAERLATPSLIEYAAAQRKIPTPKAWGEMSDRDKERYISAQGLSQDRVALASKMASEGTLQNTSKAFQEKMLSDAQKQAGNVHLKKDVEDILKMFPDKITKKMMLDLELSTLPGDKKKEKKEEIEKNIADLIGEYNFTDFDLEEIKNGKKVTTEFKAEDQAAQLLQMRKLAPKDIEKLSRESLNTKAFRLATQNMTQAHFQKLIDAHGKETLDRTLDGAGGLNELIKNEDDLEEFYLKNPGLVNFFAKNPAGQALSWSGLKFANTDEEYKRFKAGMDIIQRVRDLKDRELVLEYLRARKGVRNINEEINVLRTAGANKSRIAPLTQKKQGIEQGLRDQETKINANPELRKIMKDIRNIEKIYPFPSEPLPVSGGSGLQIPESGGPKQTGEERKKRRESAMPAPSAPAPSPAPPPPTPAPPAPRPVPPPPPGSPVRLNIPAEKWRQADKKQQEKWKQEDEKRQEKGKSWEEKQKERWK